MATLLLADRPDIPAPTIEWSLLSPLLVVAGVAMVAVLVETFWPRRTRFTAQAVLAGLGLLAALLDTVRVYVSLDRVDGDVVGRGTPVAEGAVTVDGPGVLTWGLLLVFALLSLALFAERRLDGGLSAWRSWPAAW
jgi:NADH-quinone oxidoreductase subunit N